MYKVPINTIIEARRLLKKVKREFTWVDMEHDPLTVSRVNKLIKKLDKYGK